MFYFFLSPILILAIAEFLFNKKVDAKNLARLKIKLRYKFSPLVLSKTIPAAINTPKVISPAYESD